MVTAGRVKGRKGEDGKVVGGRKWRGCAQGAATLDLDALAWDSVNNGETRVKTSFHGPSSKHS